MRSIKQIKNLKGKIILLRVDFNVPIKDGMVIDNFRIKKSLFTIDYLIKKGVEKIILITHLGKDGTADLTPVINEFFKFYKYQKSKITFFDNIRKFTGEEKNDLSFAKKLASLGDIYVNDAFSVSHRKHASLVLLPKLLPHFAGFQLEEEIKNLSKVFIKPKKPFIFILGGAKFSTKLPLIKKYLKLADYIFIGGALANNFIKTKGYEIGNSLIDDTDFNFKNLLKNKKMIIPEDVIVLSQGKLINKKLEEIQKEDIILDIGKNSVKKLVNLIKKSKLILWNGPLGKYENKGDKATKQIISFILKEQNKNIIIGGGDLVSCVTKLKLRAKSYQLKANLFISTGGGATLDFLANGTLPGIKALE